MARLAGGRVIQPYMKGRGLGAAMDDAQAGKFVLHLYFPVVGKEGKEGCFV